MPDVWPRARDPEEAMSEKPKHECRCGYRCGGPGRCTLGAFVCLAQTDDKHFVKDCDHVWGSGPDFEDDDAGIFSQTCECGSTAIYHDMRNGP